MNYAKIKADYHAAAGCSNDNERRYLMAEWCRQYGPTLLVLAELPFARLSGDAPRPAHCAGCGKDCAPFWCSAECAGACALDDGADGA